MAPSALPSGHGSSLTLGISPRNVYRSFVKVSRARRVGLVTDTFKIMLLTGPSELTDVGEGALATLQSLLASLPAFYGATELTEIARLYVDYSATLTVQHNPLTGLSKAISKKLSAEVLLPVLYDLWPNVHRAQTKVSIVARLVWNDDETVHQDDINGMVGYFTLFKRALHAAPRPEVLDNVRPLFKVFMEAFDVKMVFGFTEVRVLLCRLWGSYKLITDFCQGEPHVISAFTELVVKLNENAFRPLFRRMQDWAFVDEKGTQGQRRFDNS